MYQMIIQSIAAEKARDMEADAASARRARESRRHPQPRLSGPHGPVVSVTGTARVPKVAFLRWRLRGPRAA